jgi:rRNA processing protein Krr1/Pno1
LPTRRLVGAVRDERRPDKTVHFLFGLQLIQLLSRFLDNPHAFNLLNDISRLAHLRITSV